ncbi:MAG: FAD-dependent oxidoreductase [Alphaproteobacteria bacterium]|nr:FAD-dependent oxidoreductase [Alphaproteobacteria bacterium]
MARSSIFHQLRRTIAIAEFAERRGIPTAEAIGIFDARQREARQARQARRFTRRGVLQGGAALGVVGLGAAMAPRRAKAAPVARSDARIAVIGGGMAGLSAAYTLYNRGVIADIYEARAEAGGRVSSLGGSFGGGVDLNGQVVERGGELIDTLHTTMRGYATELGLTLEDYDKAEGEVFFWSDGALYSEDDVVDEYRDFTATLRADIRTLSPPTADSFTDADALLDHMSLEEYFDSRGPGALLRDVLEAAYVGEYGGEMHEQSSLNLLLFIHADNSRHFREFGVYSDERFHVRGGNQQIPNALAETMADQLVWDRALVALSTDSSGAYVLTFEDADGALHEATYDFVVLAIPFSVLRDVEIDPSVGFSDDKLDMIENYTYGRNSKMMIGFDGRPWSDVGSNGGTYARGLSYLQGTWESNQADSSASSGVLTNYSGGDLAASYDTGDVQTELTRFLSDYERIVPGAGAMVRRDGAGEAQVHLAKWSENPLTRGSYTNNAPGYFTSYAEREAEPVGGVYFAGEHVDSFYEWQGFMEGAANSGAAAASEILALLRVP